MEDEEQVEGGNVPDPKPPAQGGGRDGEGINDGGGNPLSDVIEDGEGEGFGGGGGERNSVFFWVCIFGVFLHFVFFYSF